MSWAKVLFLGLLIVVGIAGYAIGAGNGSQDVVLCAVKKSGDLSLAAKGKCAKGEKKLTIAKEGPQGKQGPAGSPGPPGDPAPISARAYAYVSGAGLEEEHSKGVIAVVPTCESGEGTQECTAPPPEDLNEDWVRFCFKLGFVPDAIEVTPVMGRSYAPDAATHVEARAPAGNPSSVYSGCKKGYDDAEVRAWKGEGGFEGDAAGPGFFVVFY